MSYKATFQAGPKRVHFRSGIHITQNIRNIIIYSMIRCELTPIPPKPKASLNGMVRFATSYAHSHTFPTPALRLRTIPGPRDDSWKCASLHTRRPANHGCSVAPLSLSGTIWFGPREQIGAHRRRFGFVNEKGRVPMTPCLRFTPHPRSAMIPYGKLTR